MKNVFTAKNKLVAVVELESFRQNKVDEERKIRRLLIKLRELNYDLKAISHLPEVEGFAVEKASFEKTLHRNIPRHS